MYNIYIYKISNIDISQKYQMIVAIKNSIHQYYPWKLSIVPINTRRNHHFTLEVLENEDFEWARPIGCDVSKVP